MSYPKPSELWDMSPSDFNKWRRENDLVQLFKCFEAALPKFNEWLSENNLTVDFILQTNMPGQFFYWNTEVYLLKTTKEDNISYYFIPIENEKHEKRLIEGQSKEDGEEKTEWYKFSPYFLWVSRR